MIGRNVPRGGTHPPTPRPYAPPVTHDNEHRSAEEVADPTDRRYVEGMQPGAERDLVISSLAAFRAPEALQVGDSLPAVTVRRAAGLEPIAVPELHRGRPLLLVFGSFT